MAEKRSEGLLVNAQPLEQAECISRSMVEMRVVHDALLLDADTAWAGAINTILVTKGVRVSELRRVRDVNLTPGKMRGRSNGYCRRYHRDRRVFIKSRHKKGCDPYG